MTFRASYSTIREDELLSKLAPLYLIEDPLSCRFWQRGVNDTYRVHCADETYSLRVYRHELRTRDAVDFEMAALVHLHERGATVAHPIPRRDGGYVSEIESPEGLRYAVMTTHAGGSEPDYRDAESARLFGASVADLHLRSEGFETVHERPRLEIEYLLDESLEIIRPYTRDQAEDLKRMETEIRRAIGAASVSDLDVGLCHGDCHGCNVHQHDGALTHFDFDCCGIGFRIFDLATFRWGVAFDDNGDELWAAFLEGYRSAREIGAEDLTLVNVFMGIRQIWFIALQVGNARDFGYETTGSDFLDEEIGRIGKLLTKGRS